MCNSNRTSAGLSVWHIVRFSTDLGLKCPAGPRVLTTLLIFRPREVWIILPSYMEVFFLIFMRPGGTSGSSLFHHLTSACIPLGTCFNAAMATWHDRL